MILFISSVFCVCIPGYIGVQYACWCLGEKREPLGETRLVGRENPLSHFGKRELLHTRENLSSTYPCYFLKKKHVYYRCVVELFMIYNVVGFQL